MNLNDYAEVPGKTNKIVYVLIDLKRQIEEDIVFVMKGTTPTLNVHWTQIHSRFFKTNELSLCISNRRNFLFN